MNIFYYDLDQIDLDDMSIIASHIRESLGETIFLPTATHLLIDAPAETIVDIIDKLCVVLENIREERPEEYKHAMQMRQYELLKKAIHN